MTDTISLGHRVFASLLELLQAHAETRSERLLRSIAARSGEVVLRRDLARFGSPAQVSRALNQLLAEGKLVRIGRRLQIGKQVVTDENDLTRPAWRRAALL